MRPDSASSVGLVVWLIEGALLVDLAELMRQLGDQCVDALRGLVVHEAPRKRPVFHDLHFEFDTLVSMNHDASTE
jgi:hypothetical protein